jgi:hypothetical protein
VVLSATRNREPGADLLEVVSAADEAAEFEGAMAEDSWRRAIALYTLAAQAEPHAWEPLLWRARAYAAIGLW